MRLLQYGVKAGWTPRDSYMSPSTFVALLSLAWLTSPQQAAGTLTLAPAVAQLVIVDVHVKDSKGRPVAGLRREDFDLFEDDVKVPLTAFRGPSARSGDLLPPASAASATPAADATAAEPLTLAVYVDRWLLSPTGRKRALDQAAALAAGHIARGAQAIVIGDERGLRALTPLTRDAEVIRAELARLQSWATSSPGTTEGRQVLDNIRTRIELAESGLECPTLPPCLCVLPDLINMVRAYAGARAADARGAAERLSFLTSALGTLSGRKALIYVSDGLEQRPGLHLYDQIGTICPQALEKDFSTLTAAMQELETSPPLREAAARANAARVSLYPVDARGLAGHSAGDITQERREYAPTPKNDSIRDANLTSPLHLLAEQTGGFALLRGLDPPTALGQFDADERGHYVLGFAPGDPDGQTHILRVGLKPGASGGEKTAIRHRQSYRRAALPDRRGQRALSTMIFGLEENGLGVEAEVERTSAATAQVRVVLLLSSLKEVADRKEGSIKLIVSFRTAGDEKAAPVVRERDVTFPMGAAEMEREGGLREVVIDVPIGSSGFDFVIGVEDLSSGASSYLKRAVSPEETGATLEGAPKTRP